MICCTELKLDLVVLPCYRNKRHRLTIGLLSPRVQIISLSISKFKNTIS